MQPDATDPTTVDPTTVLVTLHAPGALPGIPGREYAPGTYQVDYQARTAVLVKPPTLKERAAVAAAAAADAVSPPPMILKEEGHQS